MSIPSKVWGGPNLESDAPHVVVDGFSDADVTIVVLHSDESVLALEHRQRPRSEYCKAFTRVAYERPTHEEKEWCQTNDLFLNISL
jgi:hypothetical protein